MYSLAEMAELQSGVAGAPGNHPGKLSICSFEFYMKDSYFLEIVDFYNKTNLDSPVVSFFSLYQLLYTFLGYNSKAHEMIPLMIECVDSDVKNQQELLESEVSDAFYKIINDYKQFGTKDIYQSDYTDFYDLLHKIIKYNPRCYEMLDEMIFHIDEVIISERERSKSEISEYSPYSEYDSDDSDDGYSDYEEEERKWRRKMYR